MVTFHPQCILKNPTITIFPSLTAGNSTHDTILKPATILHWLDDIPPIPDNAAPPRVQNEIAAPIVSLLRVQENNNKPKLPIVTLPTIPSQVAANKRQSIISALPPQLLIDPTHVPSLKKKWTRQPIPQTRYNLRLKPQGKKFQHYAARKLLAQHLFQTPYINHIYDTTGAKSGIHSLLCGSDSDIRNKAMIMEIGRLA